MARILELLKEHAPQPGQPAQEDLRGFEWYYLWQLCHGEMRTLQHDGAVTRAAFSPDGKWLATLAGRRTITLWETATGKPLRAFTAQTAAENKQFAAEGDLYHCRSYECFYDNPMVMD